MAAPEGNQYWRLRQTHGRDLEYKTPEEMLPEIIGYFEWCNENPWHKREAIKGGEAAGTIIEIPTERPYTLSGLCIHLGISMSTWKEYCKRQDFSNITTYTEEIIRTQKFEGAAVGAFNANIIARDLGLSEKNDFTSGGQPIKAPVLKLPDGTTLEI